MKSYYRVMLGAKSVYVDDCVKGNFIGVSFSILQDLTQDLTDNWRDFNKQYIPIWLSNHPGKSKVAAGLSCGAIWTVSKGIKKGDIVLSPNGSGSYYVGEVLGDYEYHPNEILPHRRTVKWNDETIDRANMTDALKNSTGSIGTVSNITSYAKEIESLIGDNKAPSIISNDPTIEDPSVFALEKHLEDFLVANWKQTDLGKSYDLYEEDGEMIGKQYPCDTGFIDLLAISKNRKELLVIELKKGRASDSVIGQIQRYMGYVLEELAEKGQTVRGIIIALDDDLRIKRALVVAPSISFYRYQVSFKLFRA